MSKSRGQFKRLPRFTELLGYRQITLKSEVEPAIFAIRNRVAEKCKADMATEDAMKGDKPSNGLTQNTVMLLRGIIKIIEYHMEKQHAKGTQGRLANLAVVHGTRKLHLVQVSERSRLANTSREIAWQETVTSVRPVW